MVPAPTRRAKANAASRRLGTAQVRARDELHRGGGRERLDGRVARGGRPRGRARRRRGDGRAGPGHRDVRQRHARQDGVRRRGGHAGQRRVVEREQDDRHRRHRRRGDGDVLAGHLLVARRDVVRRVRARHVREPQRPHGVRARRRGVLRRVVRRVVSIPVRARTLHVGARLRVVHALPRGPAGAIQRVDGLRPRPARFVRTRDRDARGVGVRAREIRRGGRVVLRALRAQHVREPDRIGKLRALRPPRDDVKAGRRLVRRLRGGLLPLAGHEFMRRVSRRRLALPRGGRGPRDAPAAGEVVARVSGEREALRVRAGQGLRRRDPVLQRLGAVLRRGPPRPALRRLRGRPRARPRHERVRPVPADALPALGGAGQAGVGHHVCRDGPRGALPLLRRAAHRGLDAVRSPERISPTKRTISTPRADISYREDDFNAAAAADASEDSERSKTNERALEELPGRGAAADIPSGQVAAGCHVIKNDSVDAGTGPRPRL